MDRLTSKMLDEIVELYFKGLSCMEAVNKIKEKYKLFLGGIRYEINRNSEKN